MPYGIIRRTAFFASAFTQSSFGFRTAGRHSSPLDRVLGKKANPSETEVIAGRLVQLLPQRSDDVTIAPAEGARLTHVACISRHDASALLPPTGPTIDRLAPDHEIKPRVVAWGFWRHTCASLRQPRKNGPRPFLGAGGWGRIGRGQGLRRTLCQRACRGD